jgi:hypothetical protein
VSRIRGAGVACCGRCSRPEGRSAPSSRAPWPRGAGRDADVVGTCGTCGLVTRAEGEKLVGAAGTEGREVRWGRREVRCGRRELGRG